MTILIAKQSLNVLADYGPSSAHCIIITQDNYKMNTINLLYISDGGNLVLNSKNVINGFNATTPVFIESHDTHKMVGRLLTKMASSRAMISHTA